MGFNDGFLFHFPIVIGEYFCMGLLSFDGQCQLAEDAPNFCSGLVSMMVFTLIFLLKVLAHRLDKGFVIGKYFRKGTFECCCAMPSG